MWRYSKHPLLTSHLDDQHKTLFGYKPMNGLLAWFLKTGTDKFSGTAAAKENVVFNGGFVTPLGTSRSQSQTKNSKAGVSELEQTAQAR